MESNQEGEQIQIWIDDNLVIEKLGKDSNPLLVRLDREKGWYGVNNIEEIANYLETYRLKRGFYSGELSEDNNSYICTFVGPPDTILRH